MPIRRFQIAEDSMRPTFVPGDEVVATDSRPAEIGDVVVFAHPDRDDFWMIKRRVVPPEDIGPDRAWVMSDNPGVTTADSRTLGALPVAALMPVVDRLDTATFAESVMLLTSEDEALATIIERYGLPDFWRREPGFSNLVLFILEQQVSLDSGAAVYRRLLDSAGAVTPQAIVALGSDGIRRAGVTRQKTSYILDLAGALLGGTLDLDALVTANRDTARSTLLGLRGIGPWTADVYLLSALGHIDMFPVGDRALQVGAAEVLGMTSIPDPEELEILSERWRPVRAVAARLIWHAYLSIRGRVEPVTPTPNL